MDYPVVPKWTGTERDLPLPTLTLTLNRTQIQTLTRQLLDALIRRRRTGRILPTPPLGTQETTE